MPNLGNPKGFNNPNLPMGGDKALPMLGQQLPLPGNAAVRLVHIEEEPNKQALYLHIHTMKRAKVKDLKICFQHYQPQPLLVKTLKPHTKWTTT